MELVIRHLPLQDYRTTWSAMQQWVAQSQQGAFSEQTVSNQTSSNQTVSNQIWLLQHAPVYTQGQAGLAQHVLDAQDIPLVQTDRGGQITYHGPGQLIVYFLLRLQDFGLQVRSLVTTVEGLIVDLMASYGIQAQTDAHRPGVYVASGQSPQLAKIASLGFRIRHGICYHGAAINVKMNLSPFQGINPCGQPGLPMTQMQEWVSSELDVDQVGQRFAELCRQCFLALSL